MNETEMAEQNARLASAEEKLAAVGIFMVEQSEALVKILKRNREYLEQYHRTFEAHGELLAEQLTLLRDITQGISALVKANAETAATTNENSEQMKTLITKIESYFGSGTGLDYDN
jgi:phosphoribosylanthranilate isomerase